MNSKGTSTTTGLPYVVSANLNKIISVYRFWRNFRNPMPIGGVGLMQDEDIEIVDNGLVELGLRLFSNTNQGPTDSSIPFMTTSPALCPLTIVTTIGILDNFVSQHPRQHHHDMHPLPVQPPFASAKYPRLEILLCSDPNH